MTPVERHVARDLEAFDRIAAAFARTVTAGDSVALEGDLGAGKTTFVAAVARALGSTGDVASPTFVFRHRYAGPTPIEHLDLYRIEDPSEAVELGLDDAFGGDAVTFVEWPDRLPGLVPDTAVRIRIAGSGSAPRDVEIRRP